MEAQPTQPTHQPTTNNNNAAPSAPPQGYEQTTPQPGYPPQYQPQPGAVYTDPQTGQQFTVDPHTGQAVFLYQPGTVMMPAQTQPYSHTQTNPPPPIQPVVMTTTTVTTSSQPDLLDGLLSYPTLLVKQKPRGWCVEMCTGCEVENEYGIYNPHQGGGKMLVAKEHSTCLWRCCCGNMRKLTMKVNLMTGEELLRIERPFRYRRGGLFCCAVDCCFQVMKVYSGQNTANPGKFLGFVREDYSFFVPVFSVFNDKDQLVYKIVGNCCGVCNYTLKIYDKHGEKESQDHVGSIKKKWSGVAKELFTDADNFFIDFPAASNSGERALL
eukprot:CAMPEP_0168576300 /NCGR_PEP_ID=MMETSP0413-20121227/20162_1 /TAXON_ID=136452 /ORGANISM="Filamoeba nolandi, Strain NC-AS-23-1" /LENGTH=324 /DNA_ID=CAMNT_0008609943 /DNA_START=35 /DNA_END=1005 /DNA_ORIENTATION=+